MTFEHRQVVAVRNVKDSRSMNRTQIEGRIRLLRLHHSAGCGHIGCSLSCIDLLLAVMSERVADERLILSKGHAAAALYTVLNMTGEIGDEILETYYKDGTRLPAHPSAGGFENIPFGLGSLGHGFPISCGIALSGKMSGSVSLTFVLMSDGETNEGTTWEAAHFAVRHGLDNLVLLIDKNGLQGFGRTEDVLGDTADPVKWESMGFEVHVADGHDLDAVTSTLRGLRGNSNGKPKVIMAHTIKGNGVPFMEDRLEWHYLPMDRSLYDEAVTHLNSLLK
jgi:transketolase